MTAGTNHPGVEKTRENHTVRVVYQDGNAKTVGIGSHRFKA